jgi:hypothetical protein
MSSQDVPIGSAGGASPQPSQTSSDFLTEQLATVKERILREAAQKATKENRKVVELNDIASAYSKYVEGAPAIPQRSSIQVIPLFIERVFSSVSALTIVSAFLAVAFGYLGYKATTHQEGLYDIAKIFAGAVVGSTGAKAATSLRRSVD